MSMDDYFYNGEVMKCYKLAKAITNEAEQERAQKYIALLEEYELAHYPKPISTLEAQSAERADETYPEFDAVAEIRAIKDEGAFTKRIWRLEEVAKRAHRKRRHNPFLHKDSSFYLPIITMRVFTAFNTL